MSKKIKLKLIKSLIGTRKTHRATVVCLGLRGIGSTAELEDTPSMRGRLNKVSYLVEIVG